MRSSARWHQQRPLTLLCPAPPPLQPCPLMLSAGPQLSGSGEFSSAGADAQPIDYSLKRHKDRSRSRSPSPAIGKIPQPSPPPPSQLDSQAHERAAHAADVVRARLDGHGRRVHLFLGVILHSALPLTDSATDVGAHKSALADIAIFCDQQRRPVDRPSQYFLVMNTQLLALTWCKFKGNSSTEFSTLTRAIRSSRQKYRGIFESVGTPCKKLYKFGDTAMQEFRHVFPSCYTDT